MRLVELLLCLGITGCSSGRSEQAKPKPCPGSGTLVELGTPSRGGPVAEFATDGGELRVTARVFHHGGIFDPERGAAEIWIGPAARPPSYKARYSRSCPQGQSRRVRSAENDRRRHFRPVAGSFRGPRRSKHPGEPLEVPPPNDKAALMLAAGPVTLRLGPRSGPGQ